MGLFDDSTSRKRDEVRIGVSEQEESESKLESDVESRIEDSRDQSSDVSLGDIHDQNERIIELLESMVKDKPDIGGSDSISDRRKNNSRENSREDDEQGMRGGMDELL